MLDLLVKYEASSYELIGALSLKVRLLNDCQQFLIHNPDDVTDCQRIHITSSASTQLIEKAYFKQSKNHEGEELPPYWSDF